MDYIKKGARPQKRRKNMESLEKVTKTAKKNKVTLALGAVAIVALIIVGVLIGRVSSEKARAKDLQEQIDDLKHQQEEVVVTPDATVTAATLREVVAPAAELTAYKYYYTDVDTYEKSQKIWKFKVPFTTDKSVFSYSGEIGAGIDLDDADFAVADKTITVTLPKPGILYHELDKTAFQSYDIKNSVFTSTDIGGYADMMAALEERQEQKLNDNAEFWKSVKANTETVLRGVLTASGELDEYTIAFKWAE